TCLEELDRDGVGLFPGGAAGNPDADRRARSLALEQPREDALSENTKGRGIAKERGDGDQEIFVERLDLRRIPAKEFDVSIQIFDAIEDHPPPDAAANRRLAVQREVDARGSAEDREDLPQLVPVFR